MAFPFAAAGAGAFVVPKLTFRHTAKVLSLKIFTRSVCKRRRRTLKGHLKGKQNRIIKRIAVTPVHLSNGTAS